MRIINPKQREKNNEHLKKLRLKKKAQIFKNRKMTKLQPNLNQTSHWKSKSANNREDEYEQ